MAEGTNGRRMLGEIEETSLDEILTALRVRLHSTSRNPPSLPLAPGHNNTAPSASKVKTYPIPPLDALVGRRFRATQSAPLSLSGRQLPLLYLLVATLLAAPCSKAVVVIDVEAKFDVTRLLQTAPYRSMTAAERTRPSEESPARNVPQHSLLPCNVANDCRPAATNAPRLTVEDLKHVHIYRPARDSSSSHIREVLKSAEQYMVYAKHASSAREWWGTIIIGGGTPATFATGNVDVTTGWKGWLRIDRDEIRGFPLGMCIEEALVERGQRQRAVDDAGYTATCQWGWFTFGDGSD